MESTSPIPTFGCFTQISSEDPLFFWLGTASVAYSFSGGTLKRLTKNCWVPGGYNYVVPHGLFVNKLLDTVGLYGIIWCMFLFMSDIWYRSFPLMVNIWSIHEVFET